MTDRGGVATFWDVIRMVFRDLAHAARSLSKSRSFTLVCVVSLGIGMTPVLAVPYFFRVISTPPPQIDPKVIVELIMRLEGQRDGKATWSYPDFADLRAASTGMDIFGWTYDPGRRSVRAPDGDDYGTLPVLFVSANYFRTLGVKLARGPGFDANANARLTAEPVVILPYDFWKRRLGSAPDIVGKTLTLNGVRHVVVGIAPEGFSGHFGIVDSRPLFVPLEQHPRLLADAQRNQNGAQLQETLPRFNRDMDWVQIHGRLMPGVSIEQAQLAISATMSRLAEVHPANNKSKSASVEAYSVNGAVDDGAELRFIQRLLSVLTGMVLVVVCLNVSGMTQVRIALRARELSIREAIGATRVRLALYLVSEAIVLALAGGLLGAVVLFTMPPLLVWWVEAPIAPHVLEALIPSPRIVAIFAGIYVATGLVVGLLPSIRFSRSDLNSVLKDDTGVGGRRVGRVHRLTAALQAGIAAPLLVMSFLEVGQALTAATATLGFQPEGVAAVRLDLATPQIVSNTTRDAASDNVSNPQDASLVLRNVRNNLEQAGGVRSVTVADGLPLDFRARWVILQTDEGQARSHVTRVGEDYLDTMGIPLLEGRPFAVADGPGAELVTVISRSLSTRLFPQGNAVGERVTFELERNKPQAYRIIGVTADFVSSQMKWGREQLLLPLAQHPTQLVYLIARSAGREPSTSLAPAFKNAVRDIDPDFAPASVLTGEGLRQRSVDDYLRGSRFNAGIATILLALTSLGIYGVVGAMVTTRTRELAVRVAVGASRNRLVKMVLFDVVKLLVPGLVFGTLLSLALVRGGFLGSQPQIGIEFLAYGVGAAITIVVALLASLASVRRAASVDPMVAMRSQ